MSEIRVLHITAHLGGGIGRVLSQLARHRRSTGSDVEDVFVCLERPITARYADVITASGARLVIAPAAQQLDSLIASADIVQFEWWHHPLLAACMMKCSRSQMRPVVWSHISGLHYPSIPPGFSRLPYAFLVTSEVSLEMLQGPRDNLLEVVNSTGGFDDLPQPERTADAPPRFGYIGSLNPAKLHPEIERYLDAVDLPGFSVAFYGDVSGNPGLLSSCKSGPLVLRGYTDQPGTVLSGMDVFVYLLNPAHYGTTENALLEAMACGVVPVVLNNRVEQSIVEDRKTGLVVNSPWSFANAISFLYNNPSERLRMSAAASTTVRARFSIGICAGLLDSVYARVMKQPKRPFQFSEVFGNSPADWFMACLGTYRSCFKNGAGELAREERLHNAFLYEKTKSSAFHFASCFPADSRLERWTAMLEADRAFAARQHCNGKDF